MTTTTRNTTSWDFLTMHAQVLLLLSADPTQTMRLLADRIGVTERAVQRVVAELEAAGYLSHERVGRQNVYTLNCEATMREEWLEDRPVAVLLSILKEWR